MTRIVEVDVSGASTKVEIIEAIGESLRFRELLGAENGRNWDALNDCLRDVDEPTRVVLQGASRYAKADPRGYLILHEIFDEHKSPVALEADAPLPSRGREGT